MKRYFTNLFLLISSIYIPMLIMSIFLVLLGKKNRDFNLNTNSDEQLKKDQKISAVNRGYLPFYHPCETKRYSRSLNIQPIGTIPHTKNYYCDEGYGLITYKTDRFGLRNEDQKWDKITNNNNIFLIGDSFIQGACVPNKYTIPKYIQNLTDINTINLGSSCNCPYEYNALLKSIVKPIILNSKTSNTVVLTFYDNDNISSNHTDERLIKKLKEITSFSLEGNVNPTKEYVETVNKIIFDNYPTQKKDIVNEINNSGEKFKNNNFNSKFLYEIFSLNPLRSRFKKTFSSPAEDSIELLSEICSDKCKPYVAYIPNSSFWRPNPNSNLFKRRLVDFTKKKNIKFIDAEKVINKNSIKDFSPEGPHLSIEGYKKVAEYITKYLK